jgi:hypothetical protein
MSFDARVNRLEREFGRADGIVVTIAADFLRGGEPTLARGFDRRGSLVGTAHRLKDEPWEAFKARIRASRSPVLAPWPSAGFLTVSTRMDGMKMVMTSPSRRAADRPAGGGAASLVGRGVRSRPSTSTSRLVAWSPLGQIDDSDHAGGRGGDERASPRGASRKFCSSNPSARAHQRADRAESIAVETLRLPRFCWVSREPDQG